MYYLVEINGSHIGIEYGETKTDAKRRAIRSFGGRRYVNSATVRQVTAEDVAWIRSMGGFVPDDLVLDASVPPRGETAARGQEK